jgi:hypothetical protein
MPSMRALRILLALALLGAQQLALSHQIWHAGKDGSQPSQTQLCGQHDALGTVAGAMNAAMAPILTESTADSCVTSIVPHAAKSPALAPSSRGPPVRF